MGDILKETEKILSIKSNEEKEKIKEWLTTKKIAISNLTKDELINAVSCGKSILNENLEFCSKLTKFSINSFQASSIKAKNKKIDEIINKYNNSNSYNKIIFNDENCIFFDYPTYLETVKLDIEGINFNIPIEIKITIFLLNGQTIEKFIIPFNYNGLYQEFFKAEDTKSLFKVGNRENIYFYECIYNQNGISFGTEKKYSKENEYDFDDEGKLVFNRKIIGDLGLILKYQPSENAYEIDINDKVVKIKLEFVDDFLGINKGMKKRLVF